MKYGLVLSTLLALASCQGGPFTINIEPEETDIFTLEVLSTTKINSVRGQTADRLGQSIEEVALLYNGQQLLDSRTIGYYNIKDGSTIFAELA